MENISFESETVDPNESTLELKKVWTIDESQRKVLLSAIHFVMAMDLYNGHGCALPPHVHPKTLMLPDEIDMAYKKLENCVTVAGLRLPSREF